MTALRLIFAYLRDRPFSAALYACMLAIGVAAATALLLFSEQSHARLTRDARHVDLVIGHKGSPLQLVLSAVFHADIPTGNVPYAEVDRLRHDRRVTIAAPIALGDSAGGFRIVGTDESFLTLHEAHLAQGAAFARPFDAVLGASAARGLHVQVGETFAGAHGLGAGGDAHEAHPYRVAGVLAPTGAVIDRLILTPHESVWELHGAPQGEARETTAILLRTRSPLFALSLRQEINAATPYLAARPADETTRLFTLIGQGAALMQAFAYVLIGAAALATFATLLSALRERRGDIALLRVMGATRATVFTILLGQGLVIAGAGVLLGVGAGHGLVEAMARVSTQAESFGLTGLRFYPSEGWIILGGLMAGALAALAPAWSAYRTDIARTLAEAS